MNESVIWQNIHDQANLVKIKPESEISCHITLMNVIAKWFTPC